MRSLQRHMRIDALSDLRSRYWIFYASFYFVSEANSGQVLGAKDEVAKTADNQDSTTSPDEDVDENEDDENVSDDEDPEEEDPDSEASEDENELTDDGGNEESDDQGIFNIYQLTELH